MTTHDRTTRHRAARHRAARHRAALAAVALIALLAGGCLGPATAEGPDPSAAGIPGVAQTAPTAHASPRPDGPRASASTAAVGPGSSAPGSSATGRSLDDARRRVPRRAPPVTPDPATLAPAEVRVRIRSEAAAGRTVTLRDPAGRGSLEPIIATHPTDPDIIAMAYTSATGNGDASTMRAALRISRDGGRTWHDTRRLPWARSGRRPSLHSAVAWGPGPSGSARLYWTGTTSGDGGVRVAIAASDDLGASWTRLHVVRDTPAWVGGFPDVTVDRDPASPAYGTAYVTYNYPAGGRRGSGIRLLASADFGRTWHGINVKRAAVDDPRLASWRFGSRVRSAPDGAVYVSTYQADLRRWDPADVFDRGGAANARRIGFAVTRLSFDRRTKRFSASPTVLAATVGRNAFTAGRRVAPGTRSHTYLDPMWSHGLDVDPVSGRVYLAIADVTNRATHDGVRGSVRVGRSDDGGRTWAWLTLPQAEQVEGRRQSAFKPSIAVLGTLVVVGMHTIDEVGQRRAWTQDATIGTVVAVSSDGGATFPTSLPVTRTRWRASSLERAVNGPGLRDRVAFAADGTLVYAYGDGRIARPGPSRAPGRRQVYVAAMTIEPSAGTRPGDGPG